MKRNDIELLSAAQNLAQMDNSNGADSLKREIALEILAGPSVGNGGDGRQTDRLLRIALALLQGRLEDKDSENG